MHGSYYPLHVSIRAPAWGATYTAQSAISNNRFQFALPRGERLSCTRGSTISTGFQFALPRGERLIIPPGKLREQGFNSRSRAGSDRQGYPCLILEVRFQFALPRGERHRSGFTMGRAPGFNSRSRVGSDACQGQSCRSPSVSIRAPAWGATFFGALFQDFCRVSIRAPAWGATHECQQSF